jgi:hypothetical protein
LNGHLLQCCEWAVNDPDWLKLNFCHTEYTITSEDSY